MLSGFYRTGLRTVSRSRRNIPTSRIFKMAFNSPPPSIGSSSTSSVSDNIPVIDLELPQPLLVQKVSEACQNFGFFQVINHGIPQDDCDNMLDTATQFFQLPSSETEQYVTKDHKKKVKIFKYHYTDEDGRRDNMQGETFTLPWSTKDETFVDLVPENPPDYKDVYRAYANGMGKLMKRLLQLMSLGLGLNANELERRIGERPELYSQANFYRVCENPEGGNIGLGPHTDIVALAVLLQIQGVSGLQFMIDDQWIYVHPIPNSFVVNVADQIHILTNGKYKSVTHRAVTNSTMQRVSMVMFYAPNDDTVIEPIEELITRPDNPPLYRSFTYAEFMKEFYSQEGKRRRVKEFFELPRSPTQFSHN